ncbi:surface antigen-domain-containing protein [Dunaliella salina]|uniref:Surface antigen-domain-containing protein n=1 Tax=Dunaliella salina TaxID=3046 RepID=A0ABQ7GM35_DUNSA|nr:surface antigen-domain-containing protein [Dunaliella salina]|eukprot:KAF5835670.1 surface antigen-domain-containing protein [Dunaliella salina]
MWPKLPPNPLQLLWDGAERGWGALSAGMNNAAGPGPSSVQHQQQQHLQFNLPPVGGRRIVRMPLPLPLASISSSSQSLQPVPQLVGNPALRQKQAEARKDAPQERILISEVEILGVEGELKEVAENALRTHPNFAYTLSEVKQDVARVFNTGFFRACVPDAVDTRDGVKLIIRVTPNDEIRGMVAMGANVLPNSVVQDTFKDLYGKTLNFVTFKQAINTLDKWYHDRGILGQVTDFDIHDGIVSLECAEATVGDVKLTFIDGKTQQPVESPRTRPEVILRHMTTAPGQVYNLKQAKRDIASIYATGLFEDVNVTPNESESSTEAAPKLDLTVNLVERKTGGLGAGGGLSTQARSEGALPGFVGSFSYNERNLFGLNQKLSALVEIGQVDKIFRVQHTDPWLLGDKHRTSRTIQVMNNRSSGAMVHGGMEDPRIMREDVSASGNLDLVIGRLFAGVEFQRPLSAGWAGTLGVSGQRTTCLGEHGHHISLDRFQVPLTCSVNPDDDSQLSMSAEVGLPLSRSWLKFLRLRGRVDKPVPLLGPLTLHLRGRGGSVVGDLPPYEAFPIGGTNSVRGYAEGGVGSGRHWLEGTAELQAPLVSVLSGSLFADWGSDLKSGASVIGNPAGLRGKPGQGYGYGAGIRADTPIGPLRLEYAWNAHRVGRFHVGVGYG